MRPRIWQSQSCAVYAIRKVLTVVEVYGLLHDAGLRRGNPQREARLLQAEVEQVLRPVSHLAVFQPKRQTSKMSDFSTHEMLLRDWVVDCHGLNAIDKGVHSCGST